MISEFTFPSLLSGINSLTEDSINSIKSWIADYRFAQANYCGVSHLDIRSQLHKAVNDGRFKEVKDGLEQHRQDQHYTKIQNWQTSLQFEALIHSFWSKIKDPHVLALRPLIDSHSCYTSYAVHMQAFCFLPNIEKWVTDAQAELAQKAPQYRRDGAFRSYQRYLKQMQKQIAREKTLLATTLFNRLCFAANSEDLTHDDILYAVGERLQQTGMDIPLPEERRQGLSVQGIKDFYDYVYQNGTKAQRKILAQQRWLLPNQKYAIMTRGEDCLLIPASLTPFVPATKGVLSGQKLRFNLAIEFQPLLQKLLSKPANYLNKDGSSAELDALEKLHREVAETVMHLEKQKTKGFFSIFYRKTNAALNSWQHYLQGQQKRLVERQVKALERIEEALTELQNNALIAKQAKFTEEKRIKLRVAIASIEPYIDGASDDVKARFNRTANRIKSVYPLSDTCQTYLFDIKEGQPPVNGKLNTLYDYHNFLSVATECKPAWYDMLVTDAIDATLKRLARRFTKHQAHAGNEDEKSLAIDLFRDVTIIQNLGKMEHAAILKKELHKYISVYLQQLDNPGQALAKQEGLILTLTEANQYLADTFIHLRIKQIRKYRQEGDQERLASVVEALKNHIGHTSLQAAVNAKTEDAQPIQRAISCKH